jgi:hypothetical protein
VEGAAVDDAIRTFGDAVGRKALARDWSGVHQLLAPWLRATMTADTVRSFFEDEYRSTLQANGVEELLYPEYPEPAVDGNNFMNATTLREPLSFAGGKVRPVAPEVTDENMRYWMKLQLQCSDEQMATLSFDTFCEVWMAIVETSEGLRVGYWSHGAY